MQYFKIAVFAIAALLSLNAVARDPVPIVNHDNITVTTGGGKALTAGQVKQAILTAAGTKNWTIAQLADGKLQATLIVRGKHTIVVEVTYTTDAYSLRYMQSSNMKYGMRDGQPVIHPFYNKWAQEFRDAIRLELSKL